MYTYLTMTVGHRAGASWVLDPLKKTRIGRGDQCTIALADARCSRVHAIVTHEDDVWRVRDARSRNGTFVNGQKVDRAVLDQGHRLRVGSTEFVLHESEQPPTVVSLSDSNLAQAIIKDTRVGPFESDAFSPPAVGDLPQVQELLLVYRLCTRLLGCADPEQMIRWSLDLLRERTEASAVAFLRTGDDGRLTPEMVIPDAAPQIPDSVPLARLVCEEGHAVWIANQHQDAPEDGLRHHADVIWVPLVAGDRTIGAIWVYLDCGRFRPSHFDLAITVANVAAAALGRARKEQALPGQLARLQDHSPGFAGLVGDGPAVPASLRIDDWQQALVAAALERAAGSVPEAARLLGIGRATLYRKIDEYGISR